MPSRRYDVYNWDEDDWGRHLYGDDYNPADPTQQQEIQDAMQGTAADLDRRIDGERESRYNWDDQ